VCQGIVRGNGGEIRFRPSTGSATFELELPLNQASAKNTFWSEAPKPPRVLTILLVDADTAAIKQTLPSLAVRGHRGVPVASQEAADLAQRLRFDAVLWFVSPGAPSWTEFLAGFQGKAPAFVLVSDAWDTAVAKRLEESRSFLLARPIKEDELERILLAIEARTRTDS
jgi:hypothetical protein